jgi:hypothetical protein
MRVPVRMGNGFKCDMCGKSLLSKDTIHINAKRLSYDKEQASKGVYTTISKADICQECYNINFIGFMRQPRK